MDYAIGIDVGTTNSKVVLCELPSCDVIHLEKFKSPKLEDGTYVDFDVASLLAELPFRMHPCGYRWDYSVRVYCQRGRVGRTSVS